MPRGVEVRGRGGRERRVHVFGGLLLPSKCFNVMHPGGGNVYHLSNGVLVLGRRLSKLALHCRVCSMLVITTRLPSPPSRSPQILRRYDWRVRGKRVHWCVRMRRRVLLPNWWHFEWRTTLPVGLLLRGWGFGQNKVSGGALWERNGLGLLVSVYCVHSACGGHVLCSGRD